MALLSDHEIRELCVKNHMIAPFCEELITKGQISYGLSSYGYDARASNHFKIFSNQNLRLVDPKEKIDDAFEHHIGDYCIVPPNSFALTSTAEYFRMPRNVIALCLGKSTYARCGLIINVTPLEPEWEGNVTIEISNTTSLPIKIYSGEGICQFVFLRGNSDCEVSYKDRKGKYMGQIGITLPRL